MEMNRFRTILIALLAALVFIPLQGFAQPGYGRRDTITVRGCGIDNCADTVFVLSDTLKAEPSIRTNLFYCASASANLGFEFPLGEHFSIGANLGLKSGHAGCYGTQTMRILSNGVTYL